jgi:hypothetical protein
MSRGKRYTEDQIVKVLQEIEAGGHDWFPKN